MPYEVRWGKRAVRELGDLVPDMQRRVLAATRALADDPRPHGCKSLRGAWSGHLRIRVGDHRVVYVVTDAVRVVDVVRVSDRKDVY